MTELFNKIILKKSNVSNKIPTINDLEYGELAINYNDGLLFYRTATDNINWFSARIQYMSSETPTDNLLPGELWWDPDVNSLFVYYNDGNMSHWVEITSQILVEGPSGTFTLFGNLIITGDTTIEGTLYETSDINLKKNVVTIDKALELIDRLRGVDFNWIANSQQSMGVISQEVELVFPYLVRDNENGIKTVNYIAFIGLLIEGIKSLSHELNNTKLVIEGMKNGN
jgi:hypothetical protein